MWVMTRKRDVMHYSTCTASICIGMFLVALSGCLQQASNAADVQVDLTLDPSPPVVGDAEVSLKLTDSSGAPLKGADLRVEGNMNHAGMKPSFADLEEVEPGSYAGTLKFTMGGDWFLLVTGKTLDGKNVDAKIDVPGVKAN